MEYEDALALMRSLHIRHKFEQIGHPEYLELMARAHGAVQRAGPCVLPHGGDAALRVQGPRGESVRHLADGRFVALDGLAEFAAAPHGRGVEPAGEPREPGRVLPARGVAVVGVSSDLSKYSMARDIAELLHELHREDLYLVNPREGSLQFGNARLPAVRRRRRRCPRRWSLPCTPHPRRTPPAFLRSLAGHRVRAVVLIPGVPSSIPYAEFARQLRESVPPGIRVIGPNCMGVYHARVGREARGEHALHQ